MPRVPLIERQTQGTAVPGIINARPEAFGAGLGEANAQTGEVFQKAAQRLNEHALQMQEREDISNLMESTNNMQLEIDALLNDPKTGLAKKGLKDAYGTTATYDQKVAEIRAKYKNQVLAPSMQNRFDETANSYVNHGRDIISNHEAAQRDTQEKLTLKNTLDTNMSEYLKNPTPDNFERFASMNDITVAEFYLRRGADQETVAAEMVKERARLVAMGISSMLENPNQAEAAREFFKANSTLLNEANPEGKLKLESAIKKAVLANVSDRVETIKATGSNYYAKLGDFDAPFEAIARDIETLGKEQGWTPEMTEIKKKAAQTEFVAAQIDRILKNEGDNNKAWQFFETYKGLIDPKMAAGLEATIRDGALSNEVNSFFNSTLKSMTLLDGSADLEAQKKAIAEKFKGPAQERALAIYERTVADNEQNRNRVEASMQEYSRNGIDAVLLKKGTKAQCMAVINDPKVKLTSQQRLTLIRYIDNQFDTPSGTGTGSVPDYYNNMYWAAAMDSFSTRQGVWVNKRGQLVNPQTDRNSEQKPVTIGMINSWYTSGYIDEKVWKSLMGKINSRSDSEFSREDSERYSYIKKKAAALYPKDLARQTEFIRYADSQTNTMNLRQTTEFVEKSGLKVSFDADFNTYRNNPGTYSNIRILKDFGLPTDARHEKAVNLLQSNNVPVTKANILQLIADGKV